jgi:hypothetical protein
MTTNDIDDEDDVEEDEEVDSEGNICTLYDDGYDDRPHSDPDREDFHADG